MLFSKHVQTHGKNAYFWTIQKFVKQLSFFEWWWKNSNLKFCTSVESWRRVGVLLSEVWFRRGDGRSGADLFAVLRIIARLAPHHNLKTIWKKMIEKKYNLIILKNEILNFDVIVYVWCHATAARSFSVKVTADGCWCATAQIAGLTHKLEISQKQFTNI